MLGAHVRSEAHAKAMRGTYKGGDFFVRAREYENPSKGTHSMLSSRLPTESLNHV